MLPCKRQIAFIINHVGLLRNVRTLAPQRTVCVQSHVCMLKHIHIETTERTHVRRDAGLNYFFTLCSQYPSKGV